MNLRKVAIVGIGGIFPACKDLNDFETKIFSGESLIREWDEVLKYGSQIKSKVSGYILPEESGLEVVPSRFLQDYVQTYQDTLERIPPINLSTADLGSAWAMLATQDVIAMSGWSEDEVISERTGVLIGSGTGGNEVLRKFWNSFFYHGKKARALTPHNVDRTMTYREAANVSCLIKNKGICESVSAACATGLGNIGYGYRLIAWGLQDRVLAGGTEGTSIESFVGFDSMQILSTGHSPQESSRPFDIDRNGFVCSFGCGMVALEEYESAKARGANVLAVIDRYCNNSDGAGKMFTPSFRGKLRLLEGLLGKEKDGLFPDVIKLQANSTNLGDALELLSVVDFFGDKGFIASAPKSQFGHMLGAAGSVELITAILMLKNQKCLPCLNSNALNEEPESFQLEEEWQGPMDPLAAYRTLLPQSVVDHEIHRILCLSYGFGGTNAAMLISKDD